MKITSRFRIRVRNEDYESYKSKKTKLWHVILRNNQKRGKKILHKSKGGLDMARFVIIILTCILKVDAKKSLWYVLWFTMDDKETSLICLRNTTKERFTDKRTRLQQLVEWPSSLLKCSRNICFYVGEVSIVQRLYVVFIIDILVIKDHWRYCVDIYDIMWAIYDKCYKPWFYMARLTSSWYRWQGLTSSWY